MILSRVEQTSLTKTCVYASLGSGVCFVTNNDRTASMSSNFYCTLSLFVISALIA